MYSVSLLCYLVGFYAMVAFEFGWILLIAVVLYVVAFALLVDYCYFFTCGVRGWWFCAVVFGWCLVLSVD